MLYYVYVKKFLISVCNPITSKDELTATKGGMCLVLLSTTRHVWKPVICRSYFKNVYTLNRYTLSKYINVLTKTLLTVPVFVLTPENPDYSNHLGTFDIDSIYVVDLICLTKATVPNQRNIHKSTTNKQTTRTPTPTINGDISREFEPHQRLPLFPCTRNVTLIA